jgi:thioester reductase-like protein
MKKHHILLTGATGALGRTLVPQLLREPSVECIYVLLRQAPKENLPARVLPIFGDIRLPQGLGLSKLHHDLLQKNVTGILHAAADTRFDAPYAEAYATNVTGTENLLRFASSCTRLDRFVHLSTLCTAGKRTGRLREVPLENRHGFVNHYEATKSAAEFVVQQYGTHLPVSIIRLATVIGHEKTGAIHQIGALHRALRLMYCSLVPMMPARPHCPVDLISVEYATQATVELLCNRFSEESIYHLSAARDYLPLDELLDLTYQTFSVNRPAWRRRAIERPTVVDLNTFELFRQTVETTGAPGLIDSLRLLSSFAPQLLYPKTYDDSQCQFALAGSGICRPNLREFFPRIVASLITTLEEPRQAASTPLHLEAA